MTNKRNVFQAVARVVAPTALATLFLCGIGCGGLGASGSISPATFLLPGLGQNNSDLPNKPLDRIQPAEHREQPEQFGRPTSPQVAAYSADLVQ